MNMLDLPPDVDPDSILDDVDYEKAVREDNVQALCTIGKKEFNKLDKPLSQQLTEIFNVLFPGNGEIAVIFWASSLATAQGKPNIAIIKGDPGQGKTVLMDYIIDFIPERHVERINDASEAALFDNTKSNDYLDKKIVYLGDLGDRRGFEKTLAARKVLRTLQTDGHYSRKIKEKQKDEDGVQNWTTIYEELIGKPAAWWTSVREDADMQDQDRAIIATTNLEKADEIRYIIQHIGKSSKTGQKIKETIETWKPRIHAIFEYLVNQRVEAVIPYNLQDMNYKFRDLNRLVTLSEMMAIINQNYRIKRDNYVIVGEEDIKLIARFLDEGTGNLSKTVINRLIKIYDRYPPITTFTRDDVVSLFSDTYDSLQTGRSNVYRDLLKPVLENFNYVKDEGNGDKKIVNLLLDENKDKKPYEYYFKALSTDNNKGRTSFISKLNGTFDLELPPIDEKMLRDEYDIIFIADSDKKLIDDMTKKWSAFNEKS